MREFDSIIKRLEEIQDPKVIEGLKRFGINVDGMAYGVTVDKLRELAKKYKPNHELAVKLWETNYNEPMMLATLIADKKKFTPELMDKWTYDFFSWGICDAACFNLFRYLPFADEKIYEYAKSEQEFVRRTAFSLIAGLCFTQKQAPDSRYIAYLDLIEAYSYDSRNFVKKAVNWALRQIGKKNWDLHEQALELACKLSQSEDATTCWIGKDALRELQSAKIHKRIKEHPLKNSNL